MANDPRDAADAAATGPERAPGAAAGQGIDLFLRLLYGSTDPESLSQIPAAALAREGLAAFAGLATRTRGVPQVRARDSDLVPGGTVIDIVNDDMPFLLDSVLAEIQSRGLEVTLVFHPIFKVDRTDDGRLIGISAPGDVRWDDGRQESFIAIHLAPMSAARREEVAAAITVILGEVGVVVSDWAPMIARLDAAIAGLRRFATRVPSAVLEEDIAFLEWMKAGHFTFLGLRDYRLDGPPDTGTLVTEDTAGLGHLRDPAVHVLRRGNELVALTPEIRLFFFASEPVIVTKANVVSRVHRRVHMDYVGVKIYGADGVIVGELRMVGLFTARAYSESPLDVPILRRKLDEVARRLALSPESHAGKALANVFDTFPRDELFQISTDDLERWVSGILDLELRPRVRTFVRYDRFHRFVSALVFVPRDRFATKVRQAIGEYLAETFGGYIAAFYPHFRDGPLVRVHFIVARRTGEIPVVPSAELEAGIARLLRTWSDDLASLIQASGPASASAWTTRYQDAFPQGYRELYPPARALEDIARIERLSTERPVSIDLHRDPQMPPSTVRAAIYATAAPIRLSVRVPMLENMGFTVVDERTWRLAPRDPARAEGIVLHDMVLETFDGRPLGLDAGLDQRLEALFTAIMAGSAESDGFNRLVLAAGLDWREAAVLRAYAAYLRQLGVAFGPRYVSDVLLANADIAAKLVALFKARFNPAIGATLEARNAETERIAAAIETAFQAVASLDDDRILRHLLALIGATVRTNVFSPGADGQPHPATIAFKFDGARLTMAPAPRPYREIFLSSPRVEGVHLRFSPIARGGIRWSDRAQDYRTEVLGLAKAQQVKNAVIVPAGAKGGFLPKAIPKSGTREEIQAEGQAAYRIFVSGMLELTDDIVDGVVVPPGGMVRHDGDDPYLVVAADKGTATFSDLANGIATAHGFWLGDAFASGGSAGYDHKGLGITARGAWECVKRHFRELDCDIEALPFRVAGVGDMSGDVFGNGMLLSDHIQLVAAFDHRDIFLDPAPDPAASLAERRRLFETPRSSWADYDPAKISAGGGVFSRRAKSIPLSAEARAMLGTDAAALPPNDLMRLILSSEVDLLWFGGIGTYVRASTETDADVGDRANDSVRIPAVSLRAKVIGEGANLGLTQRGRIEAAGRGIRLNTDFIDNSAGVNTSDQEVNIKIALAPAIRAGRLTVEERNRLLAAMSGDVAAAVLRNNYQQSLAISLAERRSAEDIGPLSRLIRQLEADGVLDRGLEALPDEHALAERQRARLGMTRPELAVLLSTAKIDLLRHLLATDVPDSPAFAPLLIEYFPQALRERFAGDLANHRLRREIVATTLTNGLVNRLGPTGTMQLRDASGRPLADVVFAVMAARRMLGLGSVWQAIDALDGRIAGATQLDLYEEARRAICQTAEAILATPLGPLADAGTSLEAITAEIRALGDGALPSAVASRIASEMAARTAKGVPSELAADLARLEVLAETPAVAAIAGEAGVTVARAAAARLELNVALGLDGLDRRARALVPADDDERAAIAAAREALATAGRRLAIALLASAPAEPISPPRVAHWLSSVGIGAGQALSELNRIAASPTMTLARLTVAAGHVGRLAVGLGARA